MVSVSAWKFLRWSMPSAPSIGDPAEALAGAAYRQAVPLCRGGVGFPLCAQWRSDRADLTFGHFLIKAGDSKLVGEIR